jgi:microcystin-dependent protein
MRRLIVSVAIVGLAAASAARPAQAQEPFVGEIRFVAFDFAPTGWAKCEGQLLPIVENEALFSLLGARYGGDGRTTFALPDLRGRFPIGTGQGTSLTSRDLGSTGGTEQVTLDVSMMPAHTHPAMASSATADSRMPDDRTWATVPRNRPPYTSAVPDTPMSPAAIGISGGGQPHENMPPFLGLTCIIALYGIYPSHG